MTALLRNILPTLSTRWTTRTMMMIRRSSTEDHPQYDKSQEPGIGRALRILKNDLINVKNELKGIKDGVWPDFRAKEDFFPNHCDIVILGGGIIGSSIAYWLKQKAPEGINVVVVERDPTYSRASTTLSVGGIRQQFSLPENIQLSLFCAEFLRNVRTHLSILDMEPPNVSFNPHGYLCLASEKGSEQLRANHKLQTELGAKAELLSSSQLKEMFPWLNIDGIALGSYGLQNEGWFDPWCLLQAFKRKAMSLGAKFVQGEVHSFDLKQMPDEYFQDEHGNRYNFEYMKKVYVKTEDGIIRPLKFAIAILAGGAFSGEIAKLINMGNGPGPLEFALPVEPRKRYVFVYHSTKGPGIDCPLVIDPSGTYFRREGLGGNFLTGKSPLPQEEPDTSNLDVDYTIFENQLWPTLAHRVPSFEAIKLKSAWAGYYDYNTFDQNAILGFHPYYTNLCFATGFSGHGIQQAPGIGRAVMELLLYSKYKTIDLKRFSFDRVINNEPLFETNIF